VTGTVAQLLTFPLEPGPNPDAAAPARESREAADTERWLAAARTGDQEAFGRLVELYQRIAVRTALVALGRVEDAEDVAQESFLLAWRKLGGFRGESSFRTWLLTIVWRKALDRRRSHWQWWRRTSAHDAAEEPFADIPGREASPERSALARDAIRRARWEIARLSPTLRDTLLLAASGEYTYEQIADILGTPVGTIKWRVAEARRKVSERLDQ
jgi:RNA polymerase sigma-70 factor (ECF subfamily)